MFRCDKDSEECAQHSSLEPGRELGHCRWDAVGDIAPWPSLIPEPPPVGEIDTMQTSTPVCECAMPGRRQTKGPPASLWVVCGSSAEREHVCWDLKGKVEQDTQGLVSLCRRPWPCSSSVLSLRRPAPRGVQGTVSSTGRGTFGQTFPDCWESGFMGPTSPPAFLTGLPPLPSDL